MDTSGTQQNQSGGNVILLNNNDLNATTYNSWEWTTSMY